MNIHEYQAYKILKKYGIPIPEYGVAGSAKEAETCLNELGIDQAVIKVQVHAGGRGKAGGVKFGKSREEILEAVKALLGMKIVNNQTGEAGVVAHKVLIAPLTKIKHEYYVGAIIDREKARATMIVSPEGGMDIEEIAEKMPDRIMTQPIGLDGSIKAFRLRNIAKFMGWTGAVAKSGMKVIAGLGKAFIESDASLFEINPLVLTEDDQIVAIDAKMGIDENAIFRQKEIGEFFDPTQISPNEVEANQHDLAYIALDGEIGCMVNGAGLAMSTMDIIHHHGGSPANFLDVGGGASKEKVAAGFRILLNDPKVNAILVNIFGGIMDCGVLAEGVIEAAQNLGIKVPLVVRMEGTNVKEGKRLLEESDLDIITADSLTEAAKRVVAESKAA